MEFLARIALLTAGGWLLGRYTGSDERGATALSVLGLFLMIAGCIWLGYSLAS